MLQQEGARCHRGRRSRFQRLGRWQERQPPRQRCRPYASVRSVAQSRARRPRGSRRRRIRGGIGAVALDELICSPARRPVRERAGSRRPRGEPDAQPKSRVRFDRLRRARQRRRPRDSHRTPGMTASPRKAAACRVELFGTECAVPCFPFGDACQSVTNHEGPARGVRHPRRDAHSIGGRSCHDAGVHLRIDGNSHLRGGLSARHHETILHE